MINHKRLRLTKLALALSIALSTAPAFAQNTTAAIGGRISGPDGKPEVGAAVTIVHTESGSVSTATTNAEGRYVARGLRAGGPYTITVTKNGLTEKREGVFIQLAETAAVDATLGQPMQVVSVVGSAARAQVFNRSNMGAGTSISVAEIESLASIQRNLQDLARTDPRVSQTDKDRGEVSVAGQNSRYNSMTIDGVAVSDTFGLEGNGSPTLKQPISMEAIQSVQINVANFDVTQKGYTGGNFNAITKSGTNDFKGSVYYVYRDDSVVGKRLNQTNNTYFDAPEFEESTKGFTLGGPIIKDKLFFFANAEEFTSSRSSPNFGPLGSPQTNVGITQSSIDAAQAIAKNAHGIDIGTFGVPEGVEVSVKDTLLRLDWNINDDHRAMFRYSKTEQSEPFFPSFSSTGISLNSFFYDQVKEVEMMVGQWFADWTPTFSTEFKISSRDYDSVPDNAARLPAMALRFSGPLPAGAPAGMSTGNRFLNFGTERFRHANELGTKTLDTYIGGNLSLGDHEIKFGADYSKNDVHNLFLRDALGNYTFACVNSSASYTYEIGNVNCNTSTNAQIEAAVLENFRRGRPLSYVAQMPLPGFQLSDAAADFTMTGTGVFAQDTWSVSPNLTFSYGLRIDRTGVNQTPARNAAAAAPVIAGNAATNTAQTGGFGYDNTVTPNGKKLVQPRVGFNYQFASARPMQLRGGAGLFQGAAATVWMANPFSNPGVVAANTGCGTSPFGNCTSTPGLFNPDPDAQPSVAGTPPAASLDLLSPGLNQPSIMKLNLAFESELPWMGIVASAEYLHTKNKDAIFYENLNLGPATRTGSDGRALYYTAQGYDPTCYNSFGNVNTSACRSVSGKALRNVNYDNVLLAKETSQGKADLVTIQLKRPLVKGFGWSLHYTYTEATEVSPLTSSQSSSNYSGRSVFNPNEEVASNSSYLVKDRVGAKLTWQKAFFGAHKTTFGMYYEGRSGKPYSWTVKTDLNGDGLAGNDLMYIPSAPGSGDVSFQGDSATSHVNEDRFWSIVNANEDLKRAAGSVVGRNASFSRWVNSFDMRISQEVPGFFKGNKGVFVLDFQNVGNMINKKWGHINEVLFDTNGGQARSFVDYVGIDANGKYVYRVHDKVEDISIRQNKGESQWAIQATLRYTF